MLIPTSYKAKISRELSYPVGAKMVSEGLNGCPQFEELELWFWAIGGPGPDKIKALSTSGRSLVILSASYCQNQVVEWTVTINAILSVNKDVARAAICNEGLLLVKRWLETPRSQVWLQNGRKTCYFRWNPSTGETDFSER
ncbi:MAG: hypothetical protein ACRBF0_18835 [Calditrichia bacterium]